MCHNVVVGERHNEKEPSVMQITTIGLDIAKQVFQVHAVDLAGRVMVRRRLRRPEWECGLPGAGQRIRAAERWLFSASP